MKRSLLFLLLLITALLTAPMACAGQWQSYTYADSYRRAFSMGNQLYLLKGNCLVQADTDSWQIVRELERQDGLSASNIVDICFSHECLRLVIVYDNGLIDVLHDDGTLWTIPDLYNAPMAGTDKTINSVREQNGLLFLHTAYGFAVVDLRSEVVLHNFNLGISVKCAWLFDDTWFYSTGRGTYYCRKQGSNPYSPNGWRYASAHYFDRAVVLRNEGQPQQCWLKTYGQELYKQERGSVTPVRCYDGGKIADLQRSGYYIMASTADSLVLFDTRLGAAPLLESDLQYGQRIACTKTSPYAKANGICMLGDNLSLLYADRGFNSYSLSVTGPRTFTVSPLHDKALAIDNYQQSALTNRLVTDGQGEVCMSYIPPLSTGYAAMLKINGFFTTVNTATGRWSNYDKTSVTSYLTDGHKRFVGLTDLIADPFHPGRYLFSSLEDGIIVVENGKLLTRYDANTTNLGLEVCAPNCTRIGGMAFTREGDLWCFDEGHNYGMRVQRHTDGKWFKYKMAGLEKEYGFTHLIVTQHNGRHQVWGCQTMKYQVTNIFCYDYGTDIATSADDRYVFFKALVPDGISTNRFIPYYNRNIGEGPDGAIWLLNTSGIYVIDNPDSVFDQPGAVRTIMAGVVPTSMTVDSDQRVWVSTEDQGILLFSSDGRQQLAQFSSANSNLISDEIESVVFDATQSTLWVATKGQIATYTYDGDEFNAVDVDWTSSAYCYPATLTLGQHGAVNVYGLQDDALISIHNSQGRLLCQKTALGGIITIDASSYPVGTYTVSGIDSEGHRGELATFSVEP